MDFSMQVNRKIVIIIMFLLYTTSIPAVISIIMSREYKTINLICIIIMELLSTFFIAIFVANCIEEILLIHQYKYEKLYLDDLGKTFSKIGYISIFLIIGFKNLLIFYDPNTSLSGYYIIPLLCGININGIYMNEEELYLKNKNVRIPFKHILHVRKKDSQGAKLIALEGEYDILINEPNLKRLQSKIAIHMEGE